MSETNIDNNDMKKYNKILARCIGSSDNACVLSDVDTGYRVTVQNSNIEKYVTMPADVMDANGGFKLNSLIYLCGIEYDNGMTVWVPDQQYYPHKVGQQSVSLGTEDSCTEFKRSLIHIADRDQDDPVTGNKPAQYKVIAKEIAGMVTARSRNAEIIIGCDDDGHPIGLNDEVKSQKSSESDLRNYLSQCFGNVSFVSSLGMIWEKIDGHLILRIRIPEYHGDILLVSGTEVYYRNGSNTTRVKGTELLTLVRAYRTEY